MLLEIILEITFCKERHDPAGQHRSDSRLLLKNSQCRNGFCLQMKGENVMRTIVHKNIPSRGTGFNPGSINLFITICNYDEEKNKNKTPIGVNAGGDPTARTSFIPLLRLADFLNLPPVDRFFNAAGPGLPRNNNKKDTQPIFKRGLSSGHPA